MGVGGDNPTTIWTTRGNRGDHGQKNAMKEITLEGRYFFLEIQHIDTNTVFPKDCHINCTENKIPIFSLKKSGMTQITAKR